MCSFNAFDGANRFSDDTNRFADAIAVETA
jgi:hypothetical protein